MKKQNPKKLRLNTETLLLLDLEKVAGGNTYTNCIEWGPDSIEQITNCRC